LVRGFSLLVGMVGLYYAIAWGRALFRERYMAARGVSSREAGGPEEGRGPAQGQEGRQK
jgi:hypothetical protein